MMIQAMPASERRPSNKESKSISRSKKPPYFQVAARFRKSAPRPSQDSIMALQP
jgi:hypothetical protein